MLKTSTDDAVRKLCRRLLLTDFLTELRSAVNNAADGTRLTTDPWLTVDRSSPSQRAIRQEEILQMAATLATLPECQHRAIELHHLQGWPLAEITVNRPRWIVFG